MFKTKTARACREPFFVGERGERAISTTRDVQTVLIPSRESSMIRETRSLKMDLYVCCYSSR